MFSGSTRMTIDLLPFGCFFSDVMYFWCDSPPRFPRPRMESKGLDATGGTTSILSIPKLRLYFLRPPTRVFVKRIYLRSTNFVSALTQENGCRGSKIQPKFRAGVQIGTDRSLHGRKSPSILRVRL